MHKKEQYDLEVIKIRRQNDKAIFQVRKSFVAFKVRTKKNLINNNNHNNMQHYECL